MAENKLINSIDLDLTRSEIESLLSDVKFEIAYVVDVNHDGESGGQLQKGNILAKSIDEVGTNELTDSVYRPINSNITQYPVAGEFVLVIKSRLGDYYLTAFNLFNSKTSNIDTSNISGYVKFTDDDNTNRTSIDSDKSRQKTVLENNQSPFNELPLPTNFTYVERFGDVSIFGRYGNRITLTRSDTELGEIFVQNRRSTIELRDGSFRYNINASNVQPEPAVNRVLENRYEREQIFMESRRLFFSAGERGLFLETSGIMSLLSDKTMYLNSAEGLRIEGSFIDLGSEAEQNPILGNDFLNDFKKLMQSLVRMAENLTKQDKLVAVSNAANNFLTDMNNLGWDNFNDEQYLAEKVRVE